MLYAAALKSGITSTPKVEDGGEILHVSQACLHEARDDSVTYLMVESEGKKYAVCGLSRNVTPQAQLDIFISTQAGTKLSTHGKGEVHVLGYFEPAEGDEGEDDEESDQEDEGVNTGDLKAALTQKLAGLAKNSKQNREATVAALAAKVEQQQDEEGEEDDEEEEEEEEEGGESTEDEEDEEEGGGGSDEGSEEDIDDDQDEIDGESEEDDDASSRVLMLAKLAKQKKPAAAAPTKKTVEITKGKENKSGAGKDQNKRKAAVEVDHKQNKKAKAGGGGFESFEKELATYLRSHGRTSLSNIGTQVKKPAAVEKLGTFIKERPNIFTIENGFVSLKK